MPPTPLSLSDIYKITYIEVLTRAVLLQLEVLETDTSATGKRFDLRSEVQQFEADLIRSALEVTGGRQRRAARLLGTKVTTLTAKIRRYKIDAHL